MERKFIALLTCFILGATVSAQDYLIEAEFVDNTTSAQLSLIPGINTQYDVDFYKITYNTTDAQGNPTVASGGVSIPQSSTCNTFPMVAYCHGTVLRQNNVPSTNNYEGLVTKVFASTGFISVAPDYVGLGEGTGLHPYLHAESEATATIDLIRAAREFMAQEAVADNGQVFITGYSQGGHASMAALKYIQNNELLNEINVAGGAPSSGPYNLSGTQTDVLLSDDPYCCPGYVYYIVKSYQLAYGTLYEEESDYFISPYPSVMEQYFDGEQDQYSIGDASSDLPNVLSDFMRDSVLNNMESNPNHPLRVALQDNDNDDWAPEFPIRMYYCTGDEQVTFQNALDAEQMMTDNGAEDVEAVNVGDGLSHGDCYLPAMTSAQAFFSSLSEDCSFSGLGEELVENLFSVSPNPSTGQMQLDFPSADGELLLIDIRGRTIARMRVNSSRMTWNLTDVAPGIYQVLYRSEKGSGVEKWVKR